MSKKEKIRRKIIEAAKKYVASDSTNHYDELAAAVEELESLEPHA